MGSPDFEKPKGSSSAKITAAHLAGLRPRPAPDSPLGKWDLSTAFIAGFAFAILTVPELTAIIGFGAKPGAPHAAINLLVLLGVVGLFGILPIVFLQHLFLQNFGNQPPRLARIVSAVVALALMYFTTTAMKPLVGYDQKLAEDRTFQNRLVGEASRSPASAPVEAIREGTNLFR